MWHMASTGRGRTFTVVTCVLAMAVMAACGSAEPELPIPSLAATPPSESPKDRVYERIQGSSPLTSDEIYRLDKARLAATEAIVAECMAAQGFEYVPSAPEISSGGALPIDLSEFDEAEAARTEGYGIIAPDLAVRDPRTPSSNQLIRAALSSSERLAYDMALDGFERTENDEYAVGDDGNLVKADGVGETCRDQADERDRELKAEYTPAVLDDPIWNEFTKESSEIEGRFEADQRVLDIDAQWSECMTDRGFESLENPWAAYSLVMEPWETWKSAHRRDDGTLPTTDPEIARLQAAEIAIAVADFECREDLDYSARRQAILFAYEQQFVDAHAKDIVYLEQAWSEVE